MSVHESHKDIADVISFNYSDVDEINVFNIDSQHGCDMNSHFPGISFDNWGQILFYKNEIQRLLWVRHDDNAEDESGIITREYNNIQELHCNPETLTEGIDYIFLCRSAMRTPPHLDGDFRRVASQLANLIGLVIPYTPDEIALRWTEKEQNSINYLTGMKRIMKDHRFNRHKNNTEHNQENLQEKLNQYDKNYCEEHGLEMDEIQIG